MNRRNAVLGWGVWQVTKRAASRKAKKVKPSAEGGRPNKSLIAAAIAGAAGALTFWRKKKSSSESSR